jgi:hypothetical protein
MQEMGWRVSQDKHSNRNGSMVSVQYERTYSRTDAEGEIQRRSSACSQQPSHTDARKRRRRFNVGGVLVLNTPPTTASALAKAVLK